MVIRFFHLNLMFLLLIHKMQKLKLQENKEQLTKKQPLQPLLPLQRGLVLML
jgi:hypothetical protein